MARALIEEKVFVGRRYLRAVDMERDLFDPDALDGYIVTPSVRDGLERIVRGLSRDSSQRAFRITGPYGCGKSSFGLLVARIFLNDGSDEAAGRLLHDAVGDVEVPHYLPCVLVGRRTSLAEDVLRALIETASSPTARDRTTVAKARKILAMRQEGQRDVRAVLELLSGYAVRLSEKRGCGFLLLIDEMGRYLEFAAANREREDPSIFQLLAERAGGSGSSPLGVIGFLHHRFGDYVAGMGEWVEGEWARSSERYEEIAFQESTEQTLHLMAEALNPVGAHSVGVRKAARSLYSEASSRHMFATSPSRVRKLAESLYPFHPATLSCLASMSRRFGQNERSVFSFLQSLEPGGFCRFAHANQYDPAIWYRLDDLYDYLATQGSFRFRSTEREKRWQLSTDAVMMCADMDPFHLSVLKLVGVMSVLEPVPGLACDVSDVAWCLGVDEGQTTEALEALVSRGVAHKRSYRGDFSLWSHTSVDLEKWIEDAKAAVPATNWIGAELQRLPPARLVVAQRHYHQTGTLRTFANVVGTRAIEPSGDVDGTILVMTVNPDEDPEVAAQRTRSVSLDAGPLAIVRQRRFAASDVERAHNLACWRWVHSNCQELRIDDVARAEVDRRIAALETELLRELASFSKPGEALGQESWYRNGEKLEIGSRAELSRSLSDICDEVFSEAPTLKNELINRNKLSTAIAAARTRLFELMVERASEEALGLEGAPPERTIYLSLFHASGLHRVANGAFGFHAPPCPDPLRWAPSWALIDKMAQGGDAIRVDELLTQLARPPIGLRAGPALLLVAAYILCNNREVAVLERNSFQPAITTAHFMRMAKNPGNFALRHVSTEFADAILEGLCRGLSVWSGAPPRPELKPLVEALYRWWLTMPVYTKVTRSVDKRAQAVRAALVKGQEPIELVLETLPNACGAVRDGVIDVQKFVTTLDSTLTEIADAFPALQKRAESLLLSAFAARSLSELREQIRADYAEHALELKDYGLRVFVDRALNADSTPEAWRDGVAGLVTGRRLENWEDDAVGSFGYEVRALSRKLARNLALIRESRAQHSPVTAIYVTSSDGTERSMYVRASGNGQAKSPIAAKMRELLRESEMPSVLLFELLSEHLATEQPKEKVE